MEAFRLARRKYATPLSGIGAALKGGRWNSIGVEMLYLASNRSLAMAEVAVHLTLATVPSDLVMVTVAIPDDISMKTVAMSRLPTNWNEFPYPAVARKVGDDFVREGKACILKIPSAVTMGDHNLLVNPHHAEFKRLKASSIDPFPLDRRIFK
ncbi:MAG TPA: RES family NAD+ phosphorylase [Pyrinomonadaceae bacterium]|nr:RES family NAD+ phosphorylase [Pyrinomonadaceae bacterium]